VDRIKLAQGKIHWRTELQGSIKGREIFVQPSYRRRTLLYGVSSDMCVHTYVRTYIHNTYRHAYIHII
jgi:hypothetical protein